MARGSKNPPSCCGTISPCYPSHSPVRLPGLEDERTSYGARPIFTGGRTSSRNGDESVSLTVDIDEIGAGGHIVEDKGVGRRDWSPVTLVEGGQSSVGRRRDGVRGGAEGVSPGSARERRMWRTRRQRPRPPREEEKRYCILVGELGGIRRACYRIVEPKGRVASFLAAWRYEVGLGNKGGWN